MAEDCPNQNATCADAQCECTAHWAGEDCDECATGWTGTDCNRCLVYVKEDGNNSFSGRSWAQALQTVQAGLNLASDLGGCAVWVEQGTYKPTNGTNREISFQLVSGVDLYGGFAGTETMLYQRNHRVNVTTLSGDIGTSSTDDNSYHVVRGADNARIDGFTITQGNADGESPDNHGGGMYTVGSSTVSNCTFSENSADSGGGMYIESASPIIANTIFESNSATGGGGVFNGGDTSTTLINCAFIYNSVNNRLPMEPGGGGMANNGAFDSPAVATIINCTFAYNSSEEGDAGAIHNNLSNVMVRNSIFWSNPTQGITGIHGGSMNISYSDIDGGCDAISGATCGDGNINTDPLFVTQTVSLIENSPCVNTGSSSLVPPDVTDLDGDGNTSESTPFDLDGNPRVVDTVDMGAYEYQ